MKTTRSILSAAILGLSTALPAQLSGQYVVGPGGSFPNLAAAISALTASGVSGPTSFLVTANDTGPWTLGAFTGQGAANPVLFDGQGTVTLSGSQPMLTLTGCASVTFSGFNAHLVASVDGVVINAGTDCVFTRCNFKANPTTVGNAAVFNFSGGLRCRIDDSTFGGAWQALYATAGNDFTTVQRCRIIGGGQVIMQIAGTNFTLVNNFISGVSNYGICAGIPPTAINGVNLHIRHNSVFITHPTASPQCCSLRWYMNPAGSEVLNNIFYDWYPTSSTTVYNLWCASHPAVMNYNDLWSNQPGYTPVFAFSSNQTMASWRAQGFDLNSIQADPMFVAPSATPADLRIMTGSPCATAGTALPGVPTDFFGSARTPPVSIGAHEEAGGPGAFYAVFGAGCAGSAGVPSNTAWPPPSLGSTTVITLGNLPATNVAILVFGLSNVASVLGPLPVQLTAFGAPGCSGLVSLDSSVFLAGSAGNASFIMTIPNQLQLIGMQVYSQGLIFDPARNVMGAVTSDAAVAFVGL